MGPAFARVGRGTGGGVIVSGQGMGDSLRKATRAVASVAPGARTCAVLVVEDDPDQQWRLARALTIQGHQVVGTSSSDGAMALVAQFSVDVVLLSETVGAHGHLADRIREACPGVPVILMTRAESPLTRAEALFAGFFECLVKPFRAETLQEVLGRLPVAQVA